MPSYTLDIIANGEDNASGMLLNLDSSISGLGIAASVALGGLVTDAFEMAGGAALDFAKTGLKVATDYQSNLNMFQAVSGATADQMAAVAARAKDLGADMSLPATSAGDAALAMTELAKAGLSVTDSMTAAKGVLQMSAAGGVDNARAAEIAANALNAFGLKGTEASRVADLLAAAANASSAEVSDIADSLQQVSAVAAGAGIPIEQVTAAIAEMANKGIKGSDAGTSIKTMLLALQAPTQKSADLMRDLGISVYDADGKMRPFPELIRQFSETLADGSKRTAPASEDLAKMGKAAATARDQLATMSPQLGILHGKLDIAKQELAAITAQYGESSIQAQKKKLAVEQLSVQLDTLGAKASKADGVIESYAAMQKAATGATITMTQAQRDQALATIFGSDASRAARIIMLGGVDAFNQTTEAVTRQGAASDLAGARMKGLGGAWEGLKSTWETLQLALTEPLLGPLEQGVRAVAEVIGDLQPKLLAFIQQNLIPGVQAAVDFGTAFLEAGSKIAFLRDTLVAQLPGWLATLQSWGTAIWQWIVDAAPVALTHLQSFALNLGTQIVAAAPGLLASFAHWASAALSWLGPQIPLLLGQGMDLRNQFVGFVLANAPALITALASWSLALLGWLVDGIPDLLSTFTTGTTALIGLVGQYAPDIIAALGTWALALAQWVVDALPGLLQNLGTSVGQILDAIGRALPGLVESLGHWAAAFIDWAIDALPGLLRKLGGLYVGMYGWIADRLPGIALQLGSWALAFIEWVLPAAGKLLLNLGGLVADLLVWIIQNGPAIATKLGEWATAFGSWVQDKAIPYLQQKLPEAWNTIKNWLTTTASSITADGSVGQALGNALWNGLNSAWGRITTLASTIGMSVRDKLGEWVGAFQDVGANLIGGVWQGIQNRWGGFISDIQNQFATLPEAVRKFLGIASPSKLFATEVGQWLLPGVVQGAEDTLPQAGRDLAQMTGQLPGLSLPASAALGGGTGGGSVTNIYVSVPVQGSVVTERDLIAGIIDGVRIASRQGGGLAAMGVKL